VESVPTQLDTVSKQHTYTAHLNLHLFQDANFIMLNIANILTSFGHSIVIVHIAAYAASLGFTDDKSAVLLSVMGACNFVGRLLYGALNQLPNVSATFLYIFGWLSTGVVTIMCPFFTDYYALLIYAGLFGLLTACWGTILPQVIIEIVGAHMISSAYGYVLLFMVIGSLAGGPSAGWLYDATSVYGNSLFLGGSILVLSVVPLFIARRKVHNPVYKSTLEVEPEIEELA